MDVPTDAAIIETATAAGLPRRRFALVDAQRAALADLQGAQARLLVLVDLPRPVRDQPVRRVHRQRQAADRQIRGQLLFPGAAQLPRDRLRRHLRDRSRLPRSGGQGDDRGERRLDPLAADPLLLRHAQQEPADGLPGEADLDADQGRLRGCDQRRISSLQRRARMELARHRRSGTRRRRPRDLRLPHLGAVRPRARPSSPRSSAWRRARCRAISAAGPIFFSSASSRSGPRCRSSIS